MTRRTYAALLCFAWLLCVEALPAIHLAGHESGARHTHTADGMIVTVSFDRETTHRHADASAHAHAGTNAVASGPTASRLPVLSTDDVLDLPAHAPLGIAHHATALHSVASPLLEVLRIDLVVTEHRKIEADNLPLLFAWTRDARGPPRT